MKKTLLLILIFFISNCTINKIENNHGSAFLEIKEKKLLVNKTNKNDILQELGPPSTKSYFDNDLWIYIEKKTTNLSLITFGKKKDLKSNVLVLEIDNKGVLFSKKLYTLEDTEDIKFFNKETINSDKDTFVYGFLSSIREKVNSPKRRKKTKKQ
tara:strand:+ start:194 stop:658 length:465 start_codon:yes stop_codon:yes gene_type:complete